jgi:hypothetical protein
MGGPSTHWARSARTVKYFFQKGALNKALCEAIASSAPSPEGFLGRTRFQYRHTREIMTAEAESRGPARQRVMRPRKAH